MANTPKFNNVVVNLKAAVDQLKDSCENASDSMLLLELASVVKVGDKFISKTLWEILHPKDMEGKFVKKGTGTYLYGKGLTATFTGKSGNVSVDLEPGEKLFKPSPSGNVHLVINQHGHAKIVNASGKSDGAWMNPPHNSSWEKQYPSGKVVAVAEAEEIKAESLEEAKTKVKSPVVKPAVADEPVKDSSVEVAPKPSKPVSAKGIETSSNSKAASLPDLVVKSTKAGAPYGPNVWITPDYVDDSGEPYLLSAQGELSYSVFAPGTPPAVLNNSKGQNIDGVSNKGLLFVGSNKKAAKAWLASNAKKKTPAAAPVPEKVKEPISIPEPVVIETDPSTVEIPFSIAVNAEPGDKIYFKTSQEVGQWSQWAINSLEGGQTVYSVNQDGMIEDSSLPDAYLAEDIHNGKGWAEIPNPKTKTPVQEEPSKIGVVLNDDGVADFVEYTDKDVVYKNPHLPNSYVVVTPEGTGTFWSVGPFNGPYSEPASANTIGFTANGLWPLIKKPKSSLEENSEGKLVITASVKFTKTGKNADGSINWTVLGVSDQFGNPYSVQSSVNSYDVFTSDGELIQTFTKAKDAKAWLSVNAASVKSASVEEESKSESDEPDWVDSLLEATKELGSTGLDVPEWAAELPILDLDLGDTSSWKGNPSESVYYIHGHSTNVSWVKNTYGVDAAGKVVAQSNGTLFLNDAVEDFLAVATSIDSYQVSLVNPVSGTPTSISNEPSWITDNSLTPIPSGPTSGTMDKTFPPGTKYFMMSDLGDFLGVDSEGYINYPFNTSYYELPADNPASTGAYKYWSDVTPSMIKPVVFEPITEDYDLPAQPDSGLSEGVEEPSTSNPTPGDPKAHLAVPVTSYLSGWTGHYITKTLKDADGKPFFITSNGKPNNWEVYASVDTPPKGSVDQKTGIFDMGEAKPLAVFKQLKDAKAWLANGGSKKSPAVEENSVSSDKFGVSVVIHGQTYHLTSSASVWKHDGFKSYYIKDLNTDLVIHSDGMTSNNIGGLTVEQLNKKNSGATKIISPKAEGDQFSIEEILNTTWDFDADKKNPKWENASNHYTFSDSLDGLFLGSVYDWSYVGSLFGKTDSQFYAESNYDQWVSHAKSVDFKGMHARLTELYASATGHSKTPLKKILNRLEKTMRVFSITEKFKSDSEYFSTDDLAFLQSVVSSSSKQVANGYVHELASGALSLMKRRIAIRNAKELGFEFDHNTTNVGKQTFILSEEQLASVKKLAGEHGLEFAGFMDEQVAGKYLYNHAIGDLKTKLVSVAPLKNASAVSKSVSAYKAWLVDNGMNAAQAESVEVPLSNSELLSIGSMKDFVGEKLSALPTEFSLPDGSKATWWPADSEYELVNAKGEAYGTLSSKAAASLFASGIITSDSSVSPEASYADSIAYDAPVGSFDPDFTTIFGYEGSKQALWMLGESEVAEVFGSVNSDYIALKFGNPLLYSLVDLDSNPYKGLVDVEILWKSLADHVMKVAPDYYQSGNIDDVPLTNIRDAFGLTGKPEKIGPHQKGDLDNFLKSKVFPRIEPYIAEGSPVAESINGPKAVFPAKPNNISDDIWSLFQAANDGFPLPLIEGIPTHPTAIGTLGNSDPLLLASVPPAVWAVFNFGKTTNNLTQYKTAFDILAKAGVWKPAEVTSVKIAVHGVDYDLNLLPGDQVVKYEDAWGDISLYVVHADKTGYKFFKNYNGEFSFHDQGSMDHVFDENGEFENTADWSTVFINPIDFDFDFISKKVDGVSQIEFDTFEKFHTKAYSEVTLPGMDNLGMGDTLIAVKKDMSQKAELYGSLTSNFGSIPQGLLKLLHYGILNGNENYAKMASTYAAYGQYKPKTEATGQFLPVPDVTGKIYHQKVASGYISPTQITDSWSVQEEVAAANDLLGISKDEFYADPDKYRNQLSDLLNGVLPNPNAPQKNAKGGSALTLHPATFKISGGSHSRETWADDDGNKWFSKAFSSDPNAKARIDAEHYAMRIADMFGYNPPATAVMVTPSGKYAYVQHFAPAAGDLSGFNWNDIPETAMHHAMEQHILDWIISNHDSHGGNILRTEDGQDVYPIDRGQAFKHFPKDKLAVGYLPSGNYENVWYDKVYHAIQSGQMPKEKADAVRDAVLRKAAIVQTRNTETYRQYVVAALANRTDFPPNLPKDKFIDALVERKEKTFTDFEKLWKDVFKSAGYDFGTKTIDDYLPKKIGLAHVSVTPDFVDDVSKSSSMGVPLFFSGTELDNGHMQVFTTEAKNGSKTLRIQTKLSEDADSVLQKWLSGQTVEKAPAYKPSYSSQPAQPKIDSHTTLPGLLSVSSALVSYATTVAAHIKKGDYEFNKSTVKLAKDLQIALQDEIEKVEKHLKNNVSVYPELVFEEQKFVTSEQQDTWLLEAKKVDEYISLVTNAMDTKVSLSQSHSHLVPFSTVNTFTATSGIDTSGKPKPKKAYKVGDEVFTHWSDENYVKTAADGSLSKVSKSEYLSAAQTGVEEPIATPTGKAAYPDLPDYVQVGEGDKVYTTKTYAAHWYVVMHPDGSGTYYDGEGTAQTAGNYVKSAVTDPAKNWTEVLPTITPAVEQKVTYPDVPEDIQIGEGDKVFQAVLDPHVYVVLHPDGKGVYWYKSGQQSYLPMTAATTTLEAITKPQHYTEVEPTLVDAPTTSSTVTYPDLPSGIEFNETDSIYQDGSIFVVVHSDDTGTYYEVGGHGELTVKEPAEPSTLDAVKDPFAYDYVKLEPEIAQTPSQPTAGEGDDSEVIATAGTQILKITHKHASAFSGNYDYENDKVIETDGELTAGVSGTQYQIEFEGITILFQSHKEVSASAQKGLLRIAVTDWDGGTNKIEDALAALRSMGLELSEADEQEMELLYWRQLYGTLQNRKLNAKWQKVRDGLKAADVKTLGREQEIAAYRKWFGEVYGPSSLTKFIEQGGHLPKMSHFVTSNSDVANGRPYWLKPSVDFEKMKSTTNGKLLHHSLYSGDDAAKSIAKTGFHPTDERIRIFGKFISGMSSESDQGKGSASYLFTRNAVKNAGTGSIFMEPTTYFRTSNYSFNQDNFGDASMKLSSAPFDEFEAAKFTNNSNETLIKNGASLLDDIAVIVVHSEAIRQEIIEFYKKNGIEEIRGIPVSERIVTSGTEAQKTIGKVWDYWIEQQKKGKELWVTE